MNAYYTIIQAQLPLVFKAGRRYLAGHNMLVLLGPDGSFIGEIDGLATGADGNTKPIGYLPSDRLKVYYFNEAALYDSSHPQVTLLSGSQPLVMARWNAAIAGLHALNAKNLAYPFWGLGANSNSIASTLITCMALAEPSIPGGGLLMPGVGKMLLTSPEIKSIHENYGVT